MKGGQQRAGPKTECKMDKLWNYIIIKIEGDEIKEINIHGIVREIRPRNLVKSSMNEPKLGNSKMMNQGVTGYWRGDVEEDFNNQKS